MEELKQKISNALQANELVEDTIKRLYVDLKIDTKTADELLRLVKETTNRLLY
jgi:hypothetical protein